MAASVNAQMPEQAEMRWLEDMYLAKDDGKGKAGEPATDFAVTDVPIYVVVRLSGASAVTVRMNLVAVDVSGVKAESRVVSASYTTKDNQDRVNFTGRPDRLWTAGRYRADVFINDTLVKKLEFDVRNPAGTIKSALSFQPKPAAKPRRPKRN